MDIGKILGGIDMGDVKGALDVVMRNKDMLIGLPGMLADFGQKLGEAGDQARNAANALVGDDGSGGAARALTSIGSTLDNCKEQLGTATSLLNTAASAAKSVPLLGGTADQVIQGVQAVSGVVEQIGTLGGNMRDLAEILGTVGKALSGLGDHLGDSGSTVKQFAPISG